MVRIFGSNEVQANTIRVAGTYGYMSPENTRFNRHEHALSLLVFAWKLWIEDNFITLIDPTMYELCYQSEIFWCI
ncbi:unnamed protein product [Citrullus colocynthis]|uniref:Protein kinase domain-containing protein n=1 Tax=Citrullus colocynthis TaxID=252529 RepID=A0ABP0Z3M5_9ROSI